MAGIAAALATVVLVWTFTISPAAGQTTGTAGPGPCLGAECPAEYGFVHRARDGEYDGRDEAINVFVGRSFTVTGTAAEAEGRFVIGGDFTLAKTGTGGGYDIGIVGLGSQVPPAAGTDFVVTGGDVNIQAGQVLRAAESGTVRYAGSLTGAGTIAANLVHDENAFTPYSSISAALRTESTCYATQATTGTLARTEDQSVLFTGDGRSMLQVFSMASHISAADGGMEGIEFAGIPDGATILINMTGSAPRITSWSGSPDGRDQIDQYGQRLLWNFPDAGTVTLNGNSEFQGSVLVGSPTSTTTVSTAGFSGRLFTPGSLVHGGGGSTAGNEFHAYPFTGTLPTCGTGTPGSSTTTDSASTSVETTTTTPGTTSAETTTTTVVSTPETTSVETTTVVTTTDTPTTSTTTTTDSESTTAETTSAETTSTTAETTTDTSTVETTTDETTSAETTTDETTTDETTTDETTTDETTTDETTTEETTSAETTSDETTTDETTTAPTSSTESTTSSTTSPSTTDGGTVPATTGYSLSPGTDTVPASGSATTTGDLPPVGATSATTRGHLAYTGSPLRMWVGMGALLLIGGGALLVITRRRRA